jgi:hypothetical protein
MIRPANNNALLLLGMKGIKDNFNSHIIFGWYLSPSFVRFVYIRPIKNTLTAATSFEIGFICSNGTGAEEKREDDSKREETHDI